MSQDGSYGDEQLPSNSTELSQAPQMKKPKKPSHLRKRKREQDQLEESPTKRIKKVGEDDEMGQSEYA